MMIVEDVIYAVFKILMLFIKIANNAIMICVVTAMMTIEISKI